MINYQSDQKIEKRKNMRGGNGEVTLVHYFEKENFHTNVRLCTRLEIPPGAGIGQHIHDNEEEIYIITRGECMICEDGCEKKAAAGDAILTGSGSSHSVKSTGQEILEITAVIIVQQP